MDKLVINLEQYLHTDPELQKTNVGPINPADLISVLLGNEPGAHGQGTLPQILAMLGNTEIIGNNLPVGMPYGEALTGVHIPQSRVIYIGPEGRQGDKDLVGTVIFAPYQLDADRLNPALSDRLQQYQLEVYLGDPDVARKLRDTLYQGTEKLQATTVTFGMGPDNSVTEILVVQKPINSIAQNHTLYRLNGKGNNRVWETHPLELKPINKDYGVRYSVRRDQIGTIASNYELFVTLRGVVVAS
jgi:hypothetical protein